ncbi:MAG: acylneuraminate cytidylyltransferase family protein [Gemmatimonadota bacterium]
MVAERTLVVIPARAGSKGVPRKNLKLLGGRPLLHWAGTAALTATLPDRVVCSSDSEEICEVARAIGVDTPFLRPPELAQDDTLVVDVLAHALDWFRQRGELFHRVALLQPTSPFVLPGDVDDAIALARSTDADTVISGYPAGQRHPSTMFHIQPDRSVKWVMSDDQRMRRRQELEPVWIRSGLVYVFRAEMISSERKLYGDTVVAMEVPETRAVNLDREADFLLAEFLLARGLVPDGTESA